MQSIRFFRKHILAPVVSFILILPLLLSSCTNAPKVEKIDKHNQEYVLDRAEAVMQAYYLADFEAMTELSNGRFSESDFLATDLPDCIELFRALTQGMTWEVNLESVYSEPVFAVEVEMVHRDIFEVVDDLLINDKDFRSMMSCLVELEMGEINNDEFNNIYFPWLADRFPEKLERASRTSFSTELIFEYDEEADEWYLSELPEDFTSCSNRYNFSPLAYIPNNFRAILTLAIAKDMAVDDELEEQQYSDLYTQYYSSHDLTAKIVPLSEVQDALDVYSFLDPESIEPIRFPALGANRLLYVVYFTERFETVAFYYRLYKDSAIPENLVKGDVAYFTDLWEANILVFDDELLGDLKAGDYIFQIQLEHGGVVLEEKFTI